MTRRTKEGYYVHELTGETRGLIETMRGEKLDEARALVEALIELANVSYQIAHAAEDADAVEGNKSYIEELEALL